MTNAVSANYVELTEAQAIAESVRLADAWKDPSIPQRQWDMCVKGELENLWADRPCAAFSAFMRLMTEARRALLVRNDETVRVLEVGASSGYYGEVLKNAGGAWLYTPTDYSEAFKAVCDEQFPWLDFDVADARELPFQAGSFDIVISGCVMIHVGDWRKVIAESARVSKDLVLFHRTPFSGSDKTRYFRKEAYGIPCVETFFSEQAVLGAINKEGLGVLRAERICGLDGGGFMESWLCRKNA